MKVNSSMACKKKKKEEDKNSSFLGQEPFQNEIRIAFFVFFFFFVCKGNTFL